MSEANYKRTQSTRVDLGNTSAKVTILIEYDSPKKTQPIIETIDNVILWLSEYPNAQLNLFEDKIRTDTRMAGDGRTDPQKEALKETRPKKSADKNKTAGKKKTSSQKSGRHRAAV